MLQRRPTRRKDRHEYPQVCRELAPGVTVKRHYCRLRVWHLGLHAASTGRWESGARAVIPWPRHRHRGR